MHRLPAAVAIVCVIAAPAFAQRNLVRNPGFEDGLDGWRFWGGGAPGEIVLETEDVHSGEGALRLTNPSAAKVRAYQPSVQLNQDEPRPLHLRYRVKRGSTDPDALQCIDLYGRHVDGTGVGFFVNTSVEDVGEWVLMEHTFTPEKPVAHLGVWALNYDTTADVLFDDIEFRAEAPERLPAQTLISARTDELSFDVVEARGRVQIRNMRGAEGRTYLESPDGIRPDVNLWELTLLGPDGSTVPLIADERAQVTAESQTVPGGRQLTIRWEGVRLGDEPVADVIARIEVAHGEALAFFACDVTLRDDAYQVQSLRYPVLAEIPPLGDEPADDTIAYPRGMGAIIRDPHANPTAVAANYPSSGASMQLIALTDPDGGLYFAPHDSDGYLKVLRLSAETTEGLRYAVEHLPPAGAREWATPYPVAVGPVAGGTAGAPWYEAARTYRRWATRQAWCAPGTLAERDVPDPVANTSLMMVGHIRRDRSVSQGQPQFTPEQMRELSPEELREAYLPLAVEENAELAEQFQQYFNVPVIWWWTTWMLPAFDTRHGAQVAPRGFEEAVAAVEEAGIPVMPYVNIRRLDTGISEWEALSDAAVVDREGEPETEAIREGATAVMCPASAQWQEYFTGYCRSFVERGVTGLYIDELGTAAAKPCYATDHDHAPGPGTHWVQGRREMLRQIRATCGEIEPDFFTGGEEPCEPYIDLNDHNFTYGSRYPDNIPLWQVVYHDYSVCVGRPVGKWYDTASMVRHYPENEQKGDVKIDEFITAQAQALVYGIQPGWVRSDFHVYAPETAAWYRTLVHVYDNTTPWLLYGEMLPPPGIAGDLPTVRSVWRYKEAITAEMPAVIGSMWRAPDGTLAVVLANVSEDVQRVTLTAPEGVDIPANASASRLTDDGEWEALPGAVFGVQRPMAARGFEVLRLAAE